MSTEGFDPYAVLGVAKDATLEEIKAAYRTASKAAHPDREGGSTERMTDVNVAYMLLSDPERRAQYDKTGTKTPVESDEKKAESFMLGLLASLVRSLAPDQGLVHELRLVIAKQHLGLQTTRATTREQIAGLERRLETLEGPPENFIDGMIRHEITKGRKSLETMDADEKIMFKALEVLRAYGDRQPATFASLTDATHMLHFLRFGGA